jgi:lysophospholipase L1-like esterase
MAIPEVRYLALGDSYSIGTGVGVERSFPSRLTERWRSRGLRVELLNLAVNGYTTDDLIRDELPRVAAFGATITSLLIGANDIVVGRDPATYRSRLRAILAHLRTDGIDARRLVVVSSPDWSGAPEAARFGERARVARLAETFAVVAREEAERIGSRFFDVVPLSRSETERAMFANDRLHFSADAYAEWAAEIDAALASSGLP